MRIALAEAKKGLGRTSPNPCVGAVIVKNNVVISTGYHKKAGTPHAEVHALREAGDNAHGAAMYVTLEPCCHIGKTPPCSHAVVKSGIKRVVIGMLDPNPLVDGGGRKYLESQGIDVATGCLEEECRSINEPFLKYIVSKKPLVILKAGISLDGQLSYQHGKSGWITGPESFEKAHDLRNRFDAILVGRRTVDIDNPSLTTRLRSGKGRDPLRIILDTHLRSNVNSRVYNLESSASTLVFCGEDADSNNAKRFKAKGIEVIEVPIDSTGRIDIGAIFDHITERGLTSILVEGGGGVHTSFLQARLADKAVLFIAPLFAGSVGSPLTPGLSIDDKNSAVRLKNVTYTQLGDDMMVEGDVHYQKNNGR